MKDRKIVLVGTGFVGMSMAYSFLTTGGIDELVLVDVDEEKAIRSEERRVGKECRSRWSRN